MFLRQGGKFFVTVESQWWVDEESLYYFSIVYMLENFCKINLRKEDAPNKHILFTQHSFSIFRLLGTVKKGTGDLYLKLGISKLIYK